jgi:hypothetical protein
MVGRGVPCIFEQLHSAEFLNRDAAPVGRRAGHLQSTATLSSVLVAQHTKLPLVIPAQSVGTEPSIAAVIGGANRTLTHHARSEQLIHVLDRLDLRSDNPHHLYDTRLSRSFSMVSIVYNTVILGPRPGGRRAAPAGCESSCLRQAVPRRPGSCVLADSRESLAADCRSGVAREMLFRGKEMRPHPRRQPPASHFSSGAIVRQISVGLRGNKFATP